VRFLDFVEAFRRGLKNHVADCAAIYDRDKYDWMPSRSDLERQREGLGLPPDPEAYVSAR